MPGVLLHGIVDGSVERSVAAAGPEVRVVRCEGLDAEAVDGALDGCDVIVGGRDDFATRDVLNRAAVRRGIPVVAVEVFEDEGRLSVFLPPVGPCYRCLYRHPPPAGIPEARAADGVMGAVAPVMGALQGAEVVKLLTGRGDPLVGRMLLFDALTARFTELRIERDADCPVCGEQPAVATGQFSPRLVSRLP